MLGKIALEIVSEDGENMTCRPVFIKKRLKPAHLGKPHAEHAISQTTLAILVFRAFVLEDGRRFFRVTIYPGPGSKVLPFDPLNEEFSVEQLVFHVGFPLASNSS